MQLHLQATQNTQNHSAKVQLHMRAQITVCYGRECTPLLVDLGEEEAGGGAKPARTLAVARKPRNRLRSALRRLFRKARSLGRTRLSRHLLYPRRLRLRAAYALRAPGVCCLPLSLPLTPEVCSGRQSVESEGRGHPGQ